MKSKHYAALAALAGSVLLFGHAPSSEAAVLISEFVPGYCLDVNMSNKQVALWNCHGGTNQNFSFSGYGAVKVGNDCMDTQAAAEGKPLVMTACRNTPGQRWGYDKSSHQFKNEQGWCADIQGAKKDRGTPIIAWKCGSNPNQKWSTGRVVPIAQAQSLGLNPSQLQQLKNADSKINASGGNIVAAGAGNIVAAGAGNIVAAGAGNVISAGGLN